MFQLLQLTHTALPASKGRKGYLTDAQESVQSPGHIDRDSALFFLFIYLFKDSVDPLTLPHLAGLESLNSCSTTFIPFSLAPFLSSLTSSSPNHLNPHFLSTARLPSPPGPVTAVRYPLSFSRSAGCPSAYLCQYISIHAFRASVAYP